MTEQRIGRPSRLDAIVYGVLTAVSVIVSATLGVSVLDAQQAPTTCRIEGRATSGTTPLPGLAIVVSDGDTPVTATSTDPTGRYQFGVGFGTHHITATLTGFLRVDRDITVDAANCRQTVDLQLLLAPRTARAGAPPANAAAQQGRGANPLAASFQSLDVEELAAAAALADRSTDREAEDATLSRMLPPGFSTDAPSQAVSFAGNATSIDRDLMGERLQALGRGEFDPVTGELPPGFGTPGEGGAAGGFGGPGGGDGGGGGRGGFGPAGGGRGDFAIGGRGGRQNRYNATANYTFGGSALDASPYQLRADATSGRAPYTRHTFGGVFGGPLKIPGIYDGSRRTTFNATYNGNRGDELFDQYATVPTDAMRGGDFSSLSGQLIDPSGQPIAGNFIPIALMNPAALALLRYIPTANLPGTTRNFHHTTTTDTGGDTIGGRITHNFTPGVAGPGGRGGGGRGGGGGLGGRGGAGRGAAQQQRTSVMLNAQVQYRRNANERINVFPTLGGEVRTSSFTSPISVNIARRRTLHNLSINFSRTSTTSLNRYAFVQNVAADAGIHGVATDPFTWGVPDLSFSSLSSLRDLTPSIRRDRRLSTAYTLTRPFNRHTLRFGGDYRWDVSHNRTDANARGSFVFTGLYASGGAVQGRSATGFDFADFLLGRPQQALLQYGPGDVRLTGRSMSLFVQDDWRKSSTLTFNLGVRYELLWPFVEENGRMVNLDATEDFTAVAPVVAGGTGPFSGEFPTALLLADSNNLAPRVGVAWRIRPGTVLRGGYGVSFNAGTYSNIARQLVSQPPFAVSNTAIGTSTTPLSLTDPLATAVPAETTNNYGVERDYGLGTVQTWNADLSRDLRQVWNVGGGYTHSRGSSLDILRAPNRGPSGLRISGVQPFVWESSEGSSVLHIATFRIRRRPVRGLGGGLTYTLARSRDNAPSIAGGGTAVAQDDQNLSAEWGLSNFDRRHQVTADASLELPFGANRKWLANGGRWAALVENWRATANFIWQSGTPFTPRVAGAAADVARGTNGTLRANYNGQDVQLGNPTIDLFFNTAAFSVPSAGTFGSASRNMIIGPGSRLLNAQLSRDIRLGQTRVMTVQLNAANVLNLVNYAAIDTVVNSPTFGQVLSVRPRRSVTLNLRFRW